MSFKKGAIYPCNPATARGTATKLGSNGNRVTYTNGRTVIIRDLDDVAKTISYTQHAQPATVARISPTGYYCASADVSGTVRIWDLVGDEQILKTEVKAFAGKINDLAWDGESKRIIAVGEGREKSAYAFMMDTGSSCGEIGGHSKPINAVSIRHQRPYRAVTGSDDAVVIFHQGVPFKFDKSLATHNRFVQDVRFTNSGDFFASAGSDMKVFLYDGKTGEKVAEIEKAHTGSVMACAWSPDDKQLLTSSADRTVKLWDAETRQPITTWNMGAGVDHQQVGNTWAGPEGIVSLSMSGNLNIFDRRVGDKPSRILYGPTKGVTKSVLTSNGTLFIGDSSGRVTSFTPNGDAQPLKGDGHSGPITGLALGTESVFSTGFDDCIREIDLASSGFKGASTGTGGQPKGVTVDEAGIVFVCTVNNVEVVKDGKRVASVSVKYSPGAIAQSGKLIAVGGEDQTIYLYEWDGSQLKESGKLENSRGRVTALAFSPDGKLLAAGDSSGKMMLHDVIERKLVTANWSFHTASINSISWMADGKRCATGSLDTHVCIFNVASPSTTVPIRNAGAGGVSAVQWLSESKLASAGADGCVRTWEVTL